MMNMSFMMTRKMFLLIINRTVIRKASTVIADGRIYGLLGLTEKVPVSLKGSQRIS